MSVGASAAAPASGGGLCYFLVCFKRRDYVAFLLAALYRPGDLFLVHCDKKAPAALKGYVAGLARTHPNVVVMPSRNYSWAGYSHVQVTLEALGRALADASAWSHFICLSEEHLPLRSPDAIAADLAPRRSIVGLHVATTMVPASQADIRNRFAARYRELPGVGCFATDLAPREDGFLDRICHGSNWLVLHRDHCGYLLDAERGGRFDLFKTIVHAEEMAIPSVLAPLRGEVESRDATLVAAPHLVDNHGLQMTEALFRHGIDTPYLFIRKRMPTLTPFVDGFVRGNGFRDDVYSHAGTRASMRDKLRRWLGVRRETALLKRLRNDLGDISGEPMTIRQVNPTAQPFASRIHVVFRASWMPAGLSVRLFSQTLADYKVCIIQEVPVDGTFELPFVRDGVLYSTARVKLNGLFGYRDILPLGIKDRGFVSVRAGRSFGKVTDMIRAFIDAARSLPEAREAVVGS